MPLITDDDKFQNEQEERTKAWSKLRVIPEYIRDYKLTQQSTLSETEQQEIETTWGFWPLANPNEEMSFEFLCYFSDYNEKVSRFISPINWQGLENFEGRNGKLYDPHGDYVKDLKNFNPKISLEIDLTAPTSVLVQQLKRDIEYFKSMLEIKTSSTRTHDHLEYLTHCLLKVGLKESEIIDRLLSEADKSKTYDDGSRLAAIEAIRRRIKKHKKVQT